MRKNVNTIILIIALVLSISSLVISIILLIQDNNFSVSRIENRISDLALELEISYNAKIAEEIDRLQTEINETKINQDSLDKDKIILNYQDAQEDFERRINTFLVMLGIVVPIFTGSGIAIQYINANKIEKEIKESIEAQREIQEQIQLTKETHKKNKLIQEIEIIYNIYSRDKEYKAILGILIEKLDELLDNFDLEDFERCTYLLYKGHDLQRIEKVEEAKKTYEDACKFAERTKSNHFIADAYYKKALFYKMIKDTEKALENMNKVISYLPENYFYIRFRREINEKLMKKADIHEYKVKYKEGVVADSKRLWEIKDDGYIGGYGELVYIYNFINVNYQENDKEDMDWACKRLDKLRLRRGDTRFINKINSKYLASLSKQKQKEYAELGYIN